jgi:hypothetical protein
MAPTREYFKLVPMAGPAGAIPRLTVMCPTSRTRLELVVSEQPMDSLTEWLATIHSERSAG